MLSIGDLARHSRVTVRMLRHYEQRGLESYGAHRQLQLDSADPDNMVVEV